MSSRPEDKNSASRILEARNFLIKRAPKTREDVLKTHLVIKPLAISEHNMSKRDFIQTQPGEFECRLHMTHNWMWGGHFVFYSDCEPEIRIIRTMLNGNTLDEIRNHDMQAWGYKFRRSITGAYILDNPFFFKQIYLAMPIAWSHIIIELHCSNIRSATFVHRLSDISRRESMIDLIRIHSSQTQTIKHGDAFHLRLHTRPVEEIVFLMQPADIANIKSVTLMAGKLCLYSNMPIDELIMLGGYGLHFDFRLPQCNEPDRYQPTGFVLKDKILFIFTLKKPDVPISAMICIRDINFLLRASESATLRFI